MKVLITAGPTWEKIDAVRFLGNRSSGKLGLALAGAALARHHDLTLLLGPAVDSASLDSAGPPRVCRFESTADLQKLLEREFPEHDLLIMAAAVADYRPDRVVEGKRPRQGGGEWVLRLEPTGDVVAGIARRKRRDQRIVAFALEEPENLTQRAAQKLQRKQVDAIVANPLATMGSDEVEAYWLTADGEQASSGKLSKTAFSNWLFEQIDRLWRTPNT